MKYPKQVISFKRPQKVLGVDAELFAKTDDSPLEIHNGFSRFTVSIVDRKQNIAPTANIPARDVPAIVAKTNGVMNYYVKNIIAPKAITPVSGGEIQPATVSGLASTEKIFLRPFTGKTPLEILQENKENAKELERLRDTVLAPNVDKYPKNKNQVQAINEALEMLKNNSLGATEAAEIPKALKQFVIYSTDYKFKNKTNEKGYHLVYSINIIFDATRDNPFTVNIQNCFAPVETLPDGRKNIVMGKSENMQKAFFSLTVDEFLGFVDSIKTTKANFELMNFPGQYKLMLDNSYQHKD